MKKDMYGHEIFPLGDSGFGVSLDSASPPSLWLFHDSDGFHQCLLAVTLKESFSGRPRATDIFDDRVDEVLALFGVEATEKR